MSDVEHFEHMGVDELLIKNLADKHKLDILKGGVFDPFAKYRNYTKLPRGWNEAASSTIMRLRPKKRKERIAYYTHQIELNSKELEKKIDQEPNNYTKHIIDHEPTPHTFNVLTHSRKKDKRARARVMKKEGVTLDTKHKFRSYRQAGRETIDSAFYNIGKPGNLIERAKDYALSNIIGLSFGALVLLTSFSGYKWWDASNEYARVAEDYKNSHEIAMNALPLKRGIPELIDNAKTNLTYTDAVDEDDNDDPADISEAFENVKGIMSTLEENLSDKAFTNEFGNDSKYSWKIPLTDEPAQKAKVSSEHRSKFSGLYWKAYLKFQEVYGSLEKMTSNLAKEWLYNQQSHPTEKALLERGNAPVQEAVRIMENSYIAPANPTIVQEENNKYSSMSFWKYATMITGGILGALLRGCFKERNRNGY